MCHQTRFPPRFLIRFDSGSVAGRWICQTGPPAKARPACYHHSRSGAAGWRRHRTSTIAQLWTVPEQVKECRVPKTNSNCSPATPPESHSDRECKDLRQEQESHHAAEEDC